MLLTQLATANFTASCWQCSSLERATLLSWKRKTRLRLRITTVSLRSLRILISNAPICLWVSSPAFLSILSRHDLLRLRLQRMKRFQCRREPKMLLKLRWRRRSTHCCWPSQHRAMSWAQPVCLLPWLNVLLLYIKCAEASLLLLQLFSLLYFWKENSMLIILLQYFSLFLELQSLDMLVWRQVKTIRKTGIAEELQLVLLVLSFFWFLSALPVAYLSVKRYSFQDITLTLSSLSDSKECGEPSSLPSCYQSFNKYIARPSCATRATLRIQRKHFKN